MENVICSHEITIKKSRFISLLFKVNDISEVKKLIKKQKQLHPSSKHVCYAFIIDNNIGYSDAKEPRNTAGIQIYNALLNKQLTHYLCIVIRYFGGKELGIPGLIKAYRKSSNEAIEKYLINN